MKEGVDDDTDSSRVHVRRYGWLHVPMVARTVLARPSGKSDVGSAGEEGRTP